MLRVIWQYDSEQIRAVDLHAGAANATSRIALPPNLRCSPVFSGSRSRLASEQHQLDAPFPGDREHDVTRYYHSFPSTEEEVNTLRSTLEEAKQSGLVVDFELQQDIGPNLLNTSLLLEAGTPCLRDSSPDGKSRLWEPCQRYLGPPARAPQQLNGVNARFAWRLKGGRGDGVRIIDIEKGCNPHHEDLEGQIVNFVGPPSSHGTAVLGILCGNPENHVGITGIAHHARVKLASFTVQDKKELPNPEDALYQASQWLRPGDVLLIEVGAVRPGMVSAACTPFLPMEAWRQGRAAIASALRSGIYVVEVAANGGFDLDQVPDVPSSGQAIMVGAGDPRTGKVLLCSNRGSRVDLQGWGGEVVTAGGTDRGHG